MLIIRANVQGRVLISLHTWCHSVFTITLTVDIIFILIVQRRIQGLSRFASLSVLTQQGDSERQYDNYSLNHAVTLAPLNIT